MKLWIRWARVASTRAASRACRSGSVKNSPALDAPISTTAAPSQRAPSCDGRTCWCSSVGRPGALPAAARKGKADGPCGPPGDRAPPPTRFLTRWLSEAVPPFSSNTRPGFATGGASVRKRHDGAHYSVLRPPRRAAWPSPSAFVSRLGCVVEQNCGVGPSQWSTVIRPRAHSTRARETLHVGLLTLCL